MTIESDDFIDLSRLKHVMVVNFNTVIFGSNAILQTWHCRCLWPETIGKKNCRIEWIISVKHWMGDMLKTALLASDILHDLNLVVGIAFKSYGNTKVSEAEAYYCRFAISITV